MKRVLWISKNKPLTSQLNELKKLFGKDVRIDIDPNPFSSAQDICDRFDHGGYDEMVLIAPLSVCKIITEAGYRPLWSEMRAASPQESEVTVQGEGDRISHKVRYYKFVRFKRLEGVDVIYSDISAIDKEIQSM
jgi:hypothetical protein